MEDTAARIRAFFARFFRTDGLKDSDDIFALGFVNSLFAMQLVTWIEREFAFTVTDDDLDIRNFNSIEAISSFIGRKVTATVEA